MSEKIVWNIKDERLCFYTLENDTITMNYSDDDDCNFNDSNFICKGLTPIKFCRGKYFGGWYVLVRVIDGLGSESFEIYEMKDIFGTSSQQDEVVSRIAESGVRFNDSYDILNLFKNLWASESLPCEMVDMPPETFVRSLRAEVD